MPTIDEEILRLRTTYRHDNNLDLQRATVGDAQGNVRADIPGWVWVRVQSSNGLFDKRRVLPPAGKAMSLKAGTAVTLEYDKMGNLRIAEPDTQAQLSGGVNVVANVVQPDTTPRLTQGSIETLRVIPTNPASLTVGVKAWAPIIGGTQYFFAGAAVDLTSFVPAANTMCYAVIFVKSDYASTEVFASTARSTADVPLDSADIQECITAATAGSTPVWAIKLVGGQTTITQDNIDVDGVDLRQMVNTASGGGVGASYYQTVQAGGSDMTQRGKLDFEVGAHTSLTVTDDAANNRTKVTFDTDVAGDMNGTAGENLLMGDAVYLAADDKWYKIDVDATATVKVAKFRGFATQAINSGNSGLIRVFGYLGGFSSLTPGADVYASTTAGGITQTKPTVSAGGGQRVIIRLGFAIDASSLFIEQSPVEFVKRESLANNGTLTIEHYTDALARERKVRAYISTTTSALLTNYASSNQDQAVPLRGGTGAGGTTTITASGSFVAIGSNSGNDNWAAQSFQVTAGTLAQFTFTLAANTGSPTGTITWEIRADSSGPTGATLATGTLTPTASATNTVNVPDGLFLAASTTYWLVLHATTPAGGSNFWGWQDSTTSTYANGNFQQSTNGGSTWTNFANLDCQMAVTTVATTPFDKLGQSFQVAASTCDLVKLRLRKFGSPTGTMTLRIETNSGSAPSGTLVDANATITVAESGLTTSFADVTFDFTNFSLSASTTYWLVLSTDRTASATNYVVWGVDASSPSYASGNWATNASSAWTADSTRDAIFEVDGPVTTYESPLLVDQWGSALAVVLCRYDDGAGANSDVDTTLKNATGATIDVTCEVMLP